MFLTDLEDFDYKPYFKDGELVRGKVVLENALLWGTGSEKIAVKAGFVTDLASLPWFASIMFKKPGKTQRAAVLHDWLYRNNINSTNPPHHYRNFNNKKWSDAQFNKAMKQDGVRRWRRYLIIAGLTVGGHKAWNYPAKAVIV